MQSMLRRILLWWNEYDKS